MLHVLRRFAVVALSIVAFIATGAAQSYPERVVRIVNPYPAGGSVDVTARILAQKLSDNLGQQFIVENRSGGGGNTGSDSVAKADPDGYTLLFTAPGPLTVNQTLYSKLSFDPAKDFAPIALFATAPIVLIVHPGVAVNNVQELIALAKSKPGGLTYASAGIGTTPHLVAEQFKLASGANIVGVQYRGAAPANQDVLAGHVPMTFDLIGNAMNNFREGKFRALGITARQRSPLLPDVPTMQEAGLPEMEAGAWFAFFAPAGTPPPAIDWLNREANAIFSAPDVSGRFTSTGMTLPLGPPERLRAHVEADTKRWGEVIRRAGIKLQ
jgi:tripartite-type tricarboxylate transporter receptor subunit TctC